MQAFFVSAASGRRFCILHPALGAPVGRVLYLHPLAEEMNKSRRMVALQARALAAAGFDVLQIDLAGCGDSSGDFDEATWPAWVDDGLLACQWLDQRPGSTQPLWLWGLRSGCLLAAAVARQRAAPCNFLFWAPQLSGRLVLQQFLRLRVANQMLAGDGRGVMADLKRQLAAGDTVEVAGYRLRPELALGLEQAQLTPPPGGGTAPAAVCWLDVASQPGAAFPPAALQAQQAWSAAGARLTTGLVAGPQFWQTTEIEDAPELVAATTAAVRAPRSAGGG